MRRSNDFEIPYINFFILNLNYEIFRQYYNTRSR